MPTLVLPQVAQLSKNGPSDRKKLLSEAVGLIVFYGVFVKSFALWFSCGVSLAGLVGPPVWRPSEAVCRLDGHLAPAEGMSSTIGRM